MRRRGTRPASMVEGCGAEPAPPPGAWAALDLPLRSKPGSILCSTSTPCVLIPSKTLGYCYLLPSDPLLHQPTPATSRHARPVPLPLPGLVTTTHRTLRRLRLAPDSPVAHPRSPPRFYPVLFHPRLCCSRPLARRLPSHIQRFQCPHQA